MPGVRVGRKLKGKVSGPRPCLWELNRDEYEVRHEGRYDRGTPEIKSFDFASSVAATGEAGRGGRGVHPYSNQHLMPVVTPTKSGHKGKSGPGEVDLPLLRGAHAPPTHHTTLTANTVA